MWTKVNGKSCPASRPRHFRGNGTQNYSQKWQIYLSNDEVYKAPLQGNYSEALLIQAVLWANGLIMIKSW